MHIFINTLNVNLKLSQVYSVLILKYDLPYLTLPGQPCSEIYNTFFHLSLSFIAAGNYSVLHPVSFTS